MFWDKNYAPSANIEALLEKKDATVEEFLNEDDILQECTTQKSIMSYFCQRDVIKRLVELITTEPSDELPIMERYRHANIACEILTHGIPSLAEQLLYDTTALDLLYSYLRKEPPLNMLLSSYFVKTFTMFFVRKGERDWFLYQEMCLELLEYIKSQNDFLDLVCKHFDTSVISGMLLNIMRSIEGGKLKRLLYNWLAEAKLVERLIDVMHNPQETNKHANIAEFICDLIQHGREMRQTEEENDTFEPAFAESNPVLQIIESKQTVESLLNVILEPNAPQSAVASGISVLLMLVKPITFIDEPNSDRQKTLQARERENHEKTKEIVIGAIAPRLKDLIELLKIPPLKLSVIEDKPIFGSTRLMVCSVFTALIETKNDTISKAICETDYFKVMLAFFKEFCWNTILSAEIEKVLQAVFYVPSNELSNSTSSQQYYNPLKRHGTYEDLDTIIKSDNKANSEQCDVRDGQNILINVGSTENIEQNENSSNGENDEKTCKENETTGEAVIIQEDDNNVDREKNVPATETQKHLILNCHIAPWLLECWRYNEKSEQSEEKRIRHRLGYMGHLIKIFAHVKRCMEQSVEIRSLIEPTLAHESNMDLWQNIMSPEDGSLDKILKTQQRDLANYSMHPSEEFSCDTSSWNPRYVRVVGSDFKGDEDEIDDEYEDDINGSGSKPFSFASFKNAGSNDPFGEEGATDDGSGNTWHNNYVNFADFETHFNMFSNDLSFGGSNETTNNIDAKNPFDSDEKSNDDNECIGESQRKNSLNNFSDDIDPRISNDMSQYDTNANFHENCENSQDNTETKILNVSSTAPAELAGTIGSNEDLMNNLDITKGLEGIIFEEAYNDNDDFDDDEGMWTRPLGSGSDTALCQEEPVVEKQNEVENENKVEKENEVEKQNEMEKPIEVQQSLPNNTVHEAVELRNFNESADEEDDQKVADLATSEVFDQDQKKQINTSNVEATNGGELPSAKA